MKKELLEKSTESIKNSHTKTKFYKKWYFKIIAIIIIITLIFNCFFTIVFVSGPSMEPNFHSGNVLLGKRRYDIWRFDVVTISSTEAGIVLIKRVIGLPNETIEFKNNQLFINGEYRTDPYASGHTEDFKITLGNNEYLCLGDNRENSTDSRKLGPFSDDEIFSKIDCKSKNK